MKAPVSRLDDSDMQAAPVALVRAAERARRLAEQTGTRLVVRTLPRLDGNEAALRDGVLREDDDGDASAQAG
jgi:hypothetical protein